MFRMNDYHLLMTNCDNHIFSTLKTKLNYNYTVTDINRTMFTAFSFTRN